MAHKDVEFFRENLRRVCEGYGNSKPIAEAAGISRVYLSQVIHGKKEPSLEMACKLADAAGIPVAEMFRRPKSDRVRQAS